MKQWQQLSFCLFASLLLVVSGCITEVAESIPTLSREEAPLAGAYYTELVDIRDRAVVRSFDSPSRPEALPSDWKEWGADLYRLNCAGCHGATGQGAPGAYPALANTDFINGPYGPVVTLPMYGKGAMPSFSGLLSDAEIAMVVSYIRNTWGNNAPPVSPSQVAPFRNPDCEIPLAAFELFFGMTQGNDYASIPD